MLTRNALIAQRRLQQISEANSSVREYKKSSGVVRHKCFISYHAEDAEEVLAFVERFDSVFIPKSIGVTDHDPWVDSNDTDYIMDKVREKYLSDSTVTLVLIGACTWARKYVDWEVYSSLRKDRVNRLNGLIAIELPSVAGKATLQARVNDNVIRDKNGVDLGYARYYAYPTYDSQLQAWIEDAFQARTTREKLRNNTRARRVNNGACG